MINPKMNLQFEAATLKGLKDPVGLKAPANPDIEQPKATPSAVWRGTGSQTGPGGDTVVIVSDGAQAGDKVIVKGKVYVITERLTGADGHIWVRVEESTISSGDFEPGRGMWF